MVATRIFAEGDIYLFNFQYIAIILYFKNLFIDLEREGGREKESLHSQFYFLNQ